MKKLKLEIKSKIISHLWLEKKTSENSLLKVLKNYKNIRIRTQKN
jgi:hypothetical protein